MRSHSVLKASYRQEGEGKYGPDHCIKCNEEISADPEIKTLKTRMLKLIFVVLTALILYWILVRQAPYCSGHAEGDLADKAAHYIEEHESASHCNYGEKRFKIFEACKPCPRHAVCSGTKMVRIYDQTFYSRALKAFSTCLMKSNLCIK